MMYVAGNCCDPLPVVTQNKPDFAAFILKNIPFTILRHQPNFAYFFCHLSAETTSQQILQLHSVITSLDQSQKKSRQVHEKH